MASSFSNQSYFSILSNFSKTYPSFLTVVLKSTRPSFLIKRAALGNLKVNFHCAHWHRFFPLKKAPPLISVFSPQGRRGNRSSPSLLTASL